MKKNLLIAAIALMAVAFVSCQKDGVYKPKQRIDKITRSWESTDVYSDASGNHEDKTVADPWICEQWAWGDKTVESRTFTSRIWNLTGVSYVSEKTTYSYDDKNRITGAQYGDHKIEYTYNDDKKFSKITVNDGANLESTVEINYDGKVVNSLKVTRFYPAKKCEAALAMVLPRQIVDVVCNDSDEEIVAKDTRTVVTDITIEWDGKNIVKMDAKSNDETTVTTTYEYDGKLNPYAGFYCGTGVSAEMYSKNNVIKTTRTSKTVQGNTTITTETVETVEYEYDGKNPSTVKTTTVENRDYLLGGKHTITTVTTDVYEYTK
ncbi:MAG: hypothetical protein J5542_04155 [Bacteroidales bacterium]|nr:hypothetical protein [Bacteroidales bacterium]